MSDDEELDQNPIAQMRARIKELERESKDSKSALEEANKALGEYSSLKREMAFIKAGIDPADPRAKYFVKGYDGELTVEAIKAAAAEVQLLGGAATQTLDVDRQQLQAHQQIGQASAQAINPDSEAAYEAAIRAARSDKEVVAIARQYGKPVAD